MEFWHNTERDLLKHGKKYTYTWYIDGEIVIQLEIPDTVDCYSICYVNKDDIKRTIDNINELLEKLFDICLECNHVKGTGLIWDSLNQKDIPCICNDINNIDLSV